MIKIIDKNEWPLFRMIIPAVPGVTIFTGQSKRTTALGPIMVATAANRLWGWRVEVIDENDYKRGPKDSNGLPDHIVLQRENPAAVVGFYCGLTSAMERVWELAEFYQKVPTIAGGWHAHYCPEETLQHNIDIVVHGDGEIVIQQLLIALKEKSFLSQIDGISFLENGQVKTNLPKALEISDLNDLPFPDFGLLRYAKMRLYPIGRIRGCSKNCEFCSVKGEPRYACAEHLFNTVKWLVETRKAKHFFVVDDRSEEDLDGTFEFFRMISEKYGNRLHFTVQIRLETAKNTKLLEIMKKAGVRYACVGFESPIDSDLIAMRKGYLSSHMLEWTKILRRYFWIHGMFIAGYPLKERQKVISPKEIVRCFRKFIRKSRIDTIQIILPVPLVGTDLRERLDVFPLDIVSWKRYTGNDVCFRPDNMSVKELYGISMKIMKRFYRFSSFFWVAIRFVRFPLDHFIRGRGYYLSRDAIKCAGYFLIRQCQKRQENREFVQKLEDY